MGGGKKRGGKEKEGGMDPGIPLPPQLHHL